MSTYPSQEADQRIAEARQSKASSLDLSGLSLTVIPEAVFQLTNLEILVLNGNQIEAIPEALGQLSWLFSGWRSSDE